MLLKASKSILTIFKQYFCENPSKLVSLADFVSQKKRTSFSRIFQERKISKNKKMSDFLRFFGVMLLLFYWTDLHDIYGGYRKDMELLDYHQKKG